jgi:hypothetical protein
MRCDDLVRDHQAELYRVIRHLPPRQRRRPPRQRVGWLLIEVGLRLATEPG